MDPDKVVPLNSVLARLEALETESPIFAKPIIKIKEDLIKLADKQPDPADQAIRIEGDKFEPGQLGKAAKEFDAKCRSCPAPILWGNVDGEPDKAIPLDTKPAIYQIVRIEQKNGKPKVIIVRNHSAAVTHFATCPNAGKHSKNKKA